MVSLAHSAAGGVLAAVPAPDFEDPWLALRPGSALPLLRRQESGIEKCGRPLRKPVEFGLRIDPLRPARRPAVMIWSTAESKLRMLTGKLAAGSKGFVTHD
jgi:hypothetical protein